MQKSSKQTLWTKNYTLLTVATVFGAAGAVAGNFALSFLVFDETGSTLAAAFALAIQFIPNVFIPLLAGPWLDRLPRKPFLVLGDAANGILYALAGLFLLRYPFSYMGYLCFMLILACLGSFDALVYNSIFPNLIPAGMEHKGYTVSSMLYPVVSVVMAPLAAIMLDHLGVGGILLIQGGLSLIAAAIESNISIREENRMENNTFSFRLWWQDLKDALAYLKQERGVATIFLHNAVTSGVMQGTYPLLIAFFRTAPGFSASMYALFSVTEFMGRSLGGLFHYRVKIPKEKQYGFVFLIQQTYGIMDLCLLWISYPLMLVNRFICGFLGINSATTREAAIQCYIPDTMRARLNAFQNIFFGVICFVLTLCVGFLGELFSYPICISLCALADLIFGWLTIWRVRRDIYPIYLSQSTEAAAETEN